MEVVISRESARGCGYRKPAKDGVGIYLMGSGYSEPCERLPYPLLVCPCCGSGIKAARGFTWVQPQLMFAGSPPCAQHQPDYYEFDEHGHQQPDHWTDHNHSRCPMCNPRPEPAGLLWIGGKFYKRPTDFTIEADLMGISRKVAHIPNGFEVGKTAVYLAHRQAKSHTEGEFPNVKIVHTPGIFSAFIPVRVDLVIKDENNIPEKAIRLAEQLGEGNARIVKVIRDTQAPLLEV